MTHLDRVWGPLGRYEGFAMMVVGLILILISYIRFIRDKCIIDNPGAATSRGVTTEFIVTAVLVERI